MQRGLRESARTEASALIARAAPFISMGVLTLNPNNGNAKCQPY